ncbi:MAG TPA: deoxyribonuclease IV [Candidatus Limnocylindrales bacterium]|nr:deoxyribonuclease IV [Candidatus Limnocylindrales bacterium]
MARTLARPEPRRRLTWPAGAPAVGLHLGLRNGLLRAARRSRQIGATALQIFSDNPTAWRRRPEPPPEAEEFIAYCAREGIGTISIHASYLINLAGSAEPFASQSRAGLAYELQRAPAYGATLVNTHIGSHRGVGADVGLQRIADAVRSALEESPPSVRLVLENSSGGGDQLGSRIEELAAILEAVGPAGTERLAFCLDTAHLWGAGYDIATAEGAAAVVDRFDALVGLERLPMVHLNDSRSLLGSRTDRHEHVGAGQIGPSGLGAFLRDPRLSRCTFIMETPGADEEWDVVNLRRAYMLWSGAEILPTLPPRAFRTNRRSTRMGPKRS